MYSKVINSALATSNTYFRYEQVHIAITYSMSLQEHVCKHGNVAKPSIEPCLVGQPEHTTGNSRKHGH